MQLDEFGIERFTLFYIAFISSVEYGLCTLQR